MKKNEALITLPVPSYFSSFSLPDGLCNPTDLIWREGTPLEVMTGRTDLIDEPLLSFNIRIATKNK